MVIVYGFDHMRPSFELGVRLRTRIKTSVNGIFLLVANKKEMNYMHSAQPPPQKQFLKAHESIWEKAYLFPNFPSALTIHCHYFPDRLLRLLLLLLFLRSFIDTVLTRDYQSFQMAQLSRKLKKTFIFFSFSFYFSFFGSGRDEIYSAERDLACSRPRYGCSIAKSIVCA